MVRITRRRAALSTPLLLSPLAAARAQGGWPARPVILLVPWAPGGSNDLTARLLAPHLSERFGQSFVVENRPGAGGAVGMGQVARARPDGYTLLVSSASNHVFNHFVVLDQGYDPREALSAAAMLTDVPNCIGVNIALGVSDVQGLIAKLKASPGMGFGSSGVGSSNHLAGELFRMLTGTELVHVPYRGGGPVISDLLSNTISDRLPEPADAPARAGDGQGPAARRGQRRAGGDPPRPPDDRRAGRPELRRAVLDRPLRPARHARRRSCRALLRPAARSWRCRP